MQGKKALLVFSAFLCLLPTVTVALFAQQPDSPETRRTASNAPKQAATASGPASKSALQSLQQRCGELLKPIEGLKHMRTVERRAAADRIWDSFFEAKSDEELSIAESGLMDCVVELPSLALRRDAFQAYFSLKFEQDARLSRADAEVQKLKDEEEAEELASVKSKLSDAQASFAEAANFAVALYKEKELYLDGEIKCFRAYMDLQDRYSDTHNLAEKAIHLAEKALDRSPGLSLPPLLSAPAPQVIRIETPAVPRSLYCTSSTTPPAAPGLETWTWTNCHW